MKNIAIFSIFWLVVLSIVFVNEPNWLLAIGIPLAFVAATIALSFIPFTRSTARYIGAICGSIGNNNNVRWVILFICTIVSLIGGIKYGAGEPLLFSGIKETKEQGSYLYSDSVQKVKNYILFGEEKTDTERESADVSPVTTPKPRTWFWWKLALAFSFLTVIYLPFAIADEIAEWLQDIAEYIRRRNNEIKQTATKVTATVTGSKSEASPDGGTSKIGWFGRLYGSDLASEFTIRLLQNMAKLFSRVT